MNTNGIAGYRYTHVYVPATHAYGRQTFSQQTQKVLLWERQADAHGGHLGGWALSKYRDTTVDGKARLDYLVAYTV